MKSDLVFYNDELFSEENDASKLYFGIPVIRLNLLLTYSAVPALNHFERAVLSLGLKKAYRDTEISEKLLLHPELSSFILDNLVQRGFYSRDKGTTQDGEQALQGVYKDTLVKPVMMFFDVVHRRILPYRISPELVSTAKLQGDAVEIEHLATVKSRHHIHRIGADVNAPKIKENELWSLLHNALTEKEDETTQTVLIHFSMLERDQEGYLLSCLLPGSMVNSFERWVALNPFDPSSYDIHIHDYLANESEHRKDAASLVSMALQAEKAAQLSHGNQNLRDFIQQQLFYGAIKDEHSIIVESLSHMFEINETTFVDEKLQRTASDHQFALHNFDLLENIFRLAVNDARIDANSLALVSDNNANLHRIITIAKDCGYHLDEETKKLFSPDRLTLRKYLFRTGLNDIGSGVTLCLLGFSIANDSKPFLHDLPRDYPDLLDNIYRWKRAIRDTSRHSASAIAIDRDKMLRVSFALLETLLGYKANTKTLEEYLQHKDHKNYSLAYEKVRAAFGAEFMRECSPQFRNLLITAIDQNEEKDSQYLGSLRSIVEETLTTMLENLRRRYEVVLPPDFKLSDRFPSSQEVVGFYRELGFHMIPLLPCQTGFEVPFTVRPNSDEQIASAFRYGFKYKNFKYKNFSVKLLIFAAMASFSKPVREAIMAIHEPPVQDFIALVVAIMFLDRGHHQTQEYNEENANLLIDKTLLIINAIYTKTNLLKKENRYAQR